MKLSVQEAAVRVLGTAISVLLVSCSTATSSRPEIAAVAASPAHSYIVEAHSTDAAAKAVTDAGGKVDSRLNIIDAVEAKLTDAQRAHVLAAAGIKQVTPNAQITTQAAASVRDNFETGSFANNDGTHRWYGDWVEQNDDNNPHGGKVTIGWNDRGGRRLIVSSNGCHLSPRRDAGQLGHGDTQVQVRARRPRLRRLRFGAGQRQWWHELERARSPVRPGQRHELHQPVVQHHQLPWPRYGDSLRRQHGWHVSARTTSTSTTSRSPIPPPSAKATRSRST